MSQRQPRYNAYGEPIVPLVDARQESMAERPANREAVERIQFLLRELWPDVLHRGWYGTIGLEFSIQDGIIQQELLLTMLQKHR